MSSKLNDLDPQSLLVLYVAGELTNGDKVALEKRLAADPALAADLERLREAQVVCADALRDGDDQIRLPVSEGVAVRRVTRAMAQWQVDRARMVPANTPKGWRIPWWAYPTAAAAIGQVMPALRVSCRTSSTWSSVIRVITVPVAPARAVRPERCRYALCSAGGSAWMTRFRSSTWMPRAAMSVATMV